VLILDDALSAVDTYTEDEILSRLRAVMRQRTCVIVSHRISTVREAHQILVLDRGTSSSGARTTSSWPAAALRGSVSKAAARRGAGGVLMSMHEEEVLGKAYDGRLMRGCWATCGPIASRWRLPSSPSWRRPACSWPAVLLKVAIDEAHRHRESQRP